MEPEAFTLCYDETEGQNLPSRPHAPVVKGYGSGSKAMNARGEVLYNTNEVEPHVALEMLDHTIRMVLNDRLNNTSALGMADEVLYAENEQDAEDQKEPDRGLSPCGTVPSEESPSPGEAPTGKYRIGPD